MTGRGLLLIALHWLDRRILLPPQCDSSLWSWKLMWSNLCLHWSLPPAPRLLSVTGREHSSLKTCIYVSSGERLHTMFDPWVCSWSILTYCSALCVCVWLNPQFIFTLFVYMDWTVRRGQRGGGSATVNKRQIVRKTGLYCRSLFRTTAVGVRTQFGAIFFLFFFFFSGMMLRQKASSLTTATCRSHATPADKEQAEGDNALLLSSALPPCGA